MIAATFGFGLTFGAQGSKVLSIPMEVIDKSIPGTGCTLSIEGRFSPMQIEGAEGKAWRTDGNSSRALGTLPQIINGKQMSVSMRFAIDTYTIVEHENPGANERYVEVISCLDEGSNNGFGFFMNRTGKYLARVGIGDEIIELKVDESIPLWEWTDITLTVDGKEARLYRNGVQKAAATSTAEGVKVGGTTLFVGRANAHGELGGTETCAFNGAFDEITIYDEVITQSYTSSYADLNLPPDRYAGDRMRAKFHGQPGMNWTNETHGLYFNPEDTKWHAFFQRTGSTPMMSHQHWGHIVSDDLITWRDEVPVLAPSEYYDIKGCWSGCVFSDAAFNNGKPTIIYTGVDYAQPYVATAYCDDPVNMRKWHKDPSNPINIIDDVGDGRDTYFYRDGSDAYFMIGAKDAVHYYHWTGSEWIYKGEFYHTEEGVDNGHNTEMPNVTRIGNKWLMTTSPLAGRYGTVCLYRTGSLNDGRFVNYSDTERVDFFGCDGYGLLSPSPYTTNDGKVYAIGIVPDKLPGDLNVRHGYAHLYSLPREWSLDSEGRLMQKPYDGIKAYRNNTLSFVSSESKQLNGTMNLNPVRGREAEICVRFQLGDTPVGLNFFKNAKGKTAYISYNPSTKEIMLDYSRIAHYNNGKNSFSSVLELGPGKGEELKLHVFIDHSIVDIFVNDRYAASVRVFPEDDYADLIELFSNGECTVKNIEAYVLGAGDMTEEPVVPKEFTLPENSGKIAFLKSSAGMSIQEEAACEFFKEKLKNGNVLTTDEPEKIKATDYDCIWVHIDRVGLPKNYSNLPSEFISEPLTDALTAYVEAGGNVYLTGQATQLAQGLGRIPSHFAPNEYNSGEGNDGDDEWSINPMLMNGKYDRSGHAIFKDLESSEAFAWTTYGILYGGGSRIKREDHNCMWNLGEFEFSVDGEDNISRFEAENGACILGTWGQEQSDGWAGIIEFYPVAVDEDYDIWSGTIIANGMAACQWHVEGAGNADVENLMLLTANVFSYLANKDGIKPDNPHVSIVTPPTEPENPEDPEILESTGKVALYMGYSSIEDFNNSDHPYYAQDHLIYDFFKSRFPEGELLFSNDSDKANVESFDCIWVHCDRTGLKQGWNNLPDTFKSWIELLKDYNADGGNLYFSKMATQMVVAIGRTEHSPTEFSSGEGGFNSDDWYMNISHHADGDWKDHVLFNDFNKKEDLHGTLILLCAGGYHREDHNCMWKLNDFGGHDSFCSANNARVLGTWGHDGGQDFAGLVEFLPRGSEGESNHAASEASVEARKGTIVTNGIAGVEFNESNTALPELKKLTANILSYLSPHANVDTSVERIDENESVEEWFTLNGLRIKAPDAPGFYIRVKRNKAMKIMISK